MPDNPRVIAIIQARMASSRLPGKVLLDIAGQPMVMRVVQRAARASTLDLVVIATTEDQSDDPVQALCQERKIPCYRGNMQDVLDRFFQAAQKFQADVIVRLTADCPLIDPGILDETVKVFLGTSSNLENHPEDAHPFIQKQSQNQSQNQSQRWSFPYDFVTNRLPPPWTRTFPIGQLKAWNEHGQKLLCPTSANMSCPTSMTNPDASGFINFTISLITALCDGLLIRQKIWRSCAPFMNDLPDAIISPGWK
jgi:CTP:molybdopterin cytidylyltransferase MocA